MTKRSKRQKTYISRMRSILKSVWGNRCQICGKPEDDYNVGRLVRFSHIKEKRYTLPDLEFAHLGKTGLAGRGRGSAHRYGDIARNINNYTLLCHNCHTRFDSDVPFRQQNIIRLKKESEKRQWYYVLLRLIHKELRN